MQPNLDQFRALLAERSRFVVLSHIRPDGDAYGSSLGLALSLKAYGKEVAVYNEDGLLRNYLFLPGKELVSKTPAAAPSADTAIIAVDTSTHERLGETFVAWGRQPDVNIDHHQSNPGFGTINLIDPESPACAQILYDLIEAAGLPCPPEAATNLYAGLMTDTGSFQFRHTTAHTFEVAAGLVTRGADPTAIAQRFYQSTSVESFRLKRDVLAVTKFTHGNRVAYYRLTRDMYASTGARTDEVENFLEQLQVVGSVEVAFMLEEMEGGKTRVSLRSRGRVDVNEIAASLGGGGHRLAAGIRSSLPPDELEAVLLQRIGAALAAHGA
ncbi:MAG TPA: bifunctional oligoribonuclease/PAP phosphatase NrnA [Candidatus Methylacidiphilales bacterium]